MWEKRLSESPKAALLALIFALGVVGIVCDWAWAGEKPASSQPVQAAWGEVKRLSAAEVEAQIVLQVAPGWHIYSRDSEEGMATTLEWELPPGYQVNSSQWPEAQNFNFYGEACRGYQGRLLIKALLSGRGDIPASSARVKVSWLACQQSCLPGSVSLVLPALPSAPVAAGGGLSWWGPCLLAFLGGLLLNCMPCVFPVLWLKILALVKSWEYDSAQEGSSGRPSSQQTAAPLLYLMGVVLSFWLVAAVLALLKATGERCGWGFQMQSPVFVILLLYLFAAIALNLLGVFEVGLFFTRWQEGGGGAEWGRWGELAAGCLAVVAATPCTAPFMGTALGYALNASWWQTWLIFSSLGLGMGLPYVLLARSAWMRRLLPKPGRWMETLRHLLAWPMWLTCVYFAGVLVRLLETEAWELSLAGLVLWCASLWLAGQMSLLNRWGKLGMALCLVLAGLAPWQACRGLDPLASDDSTAAAVASAAEFVLEPSGLEGFEPWSAEAVRQAREAGQPVFVDFGASWCLTCRYNEASVLAQPEVKNLLRTKGVRCFRADWTKRDSRITAALESFGRQGVPLYVYYAPGEAQARILPEIISVADIENL